jgi:EAL domain-containing protein (putative c-di-GMP-specific phosphodiesterase class I)
MNVVAEGIETETQLKSLRALECEGGQGYLFAKPMHRAAVETFLLDAATDRAAPAPPDGVTRPQPVSAG